MGTVAVQRISKITLEQVMAASAFISSEIIYRPDLEAWPLD